MRFSGIHPPINAFDATSTKGNVVIRSGRRRITGIRQVSGLTYAPLLTLDTVMGQIF